MVPITIRITHTIWKIDALPNHLQEVSWSVWLIESVIGIDNQKAGLKGHNQVKGIITHKADGDIFQIY